MEYEIVPSAESSCAKRQYQLFQTLAHFVPGDETFCLWLRNILFLAVE